MFQRALLLATIVLGLVSQAAQAEPSKAPHSLCWALIEDAARNIQPPKSPDRQDALQEAYVKVFERCMKAAVNPEIMTARQYEGYIVRSANNLRIATYRKHRPEVIGEIFESRQLALQNETAPQDVQINTWFLSSIQPGDQGDGISDDMASAHIAAAIGSNLTDREIKVSLLRLAGFTYAEIAAATGMKSSTLHDIDRRASKKLSLIYADFERFWTPDRVTHDGPKVLLFALASAIVFILGIVSVSVIAGLLRNTVFRTEAEEFCRKESEMKAKTTVAAKVAVLMRDRAN
jgi:RNA polymerase sigma factor (sigma-70 family)